jgi:hypothetical protein
LEMELRFWGAGVVGDLVEELVTLDNGGSIK